MLVQHRPTDFLNETATRHAGDALEAALQVADAAGEILITAFAERQGFRSKQSEPAYNLVTDADLASEKCIVEFLQRRFPSHEILGEEEAQGNLDAEHLWIVDPLDGTNNFAHRIPHFAVSIAYYCGGQAQVGVVYNPARGDCYWGMRGNGSFYNGRRLSVSESESLDQVMVGVGFYYDRGAMMQATLAAIHDFFKSHIHGVRRFGTAALDLCQVAEGMFGAFFEYQLAPWDFAAGRLILEEAGGQITDGRGEPLPLAKTSVLASNRKLHAAALEIVQRHHL
jgi:myo-inositol-1(or 4)-monophosphatase